MRMHTILKNKLAVDSQKQIFKIPTVSTKRQSHWAICASNDDFRKTPGTPYTGYSVLCEHAPDYYMGIQGESSRLEFVNMKYLRQGICLDLAELSFALRKLKDAEK